ncbi:uncharacterized protein Z518_04026 [Rhinocladiella mackenziei CBS 650.93]|uniref:Glutathione S-transferase n=1 Tax=Rhinocladiella mackenziei CBS 650.93 TaxID=1442369 RepID=A0A0D2FVC6_9EURO|nr:uncharacterized protein Z518_04026 [Rhinocladiella mackenziei CBS 650.93]KIX06052.1 hypothetical protein Z518_04026 [Rhinocladiella mackenziei CBS 650.93]
MAYTLTLPDGYGYVVLVALGLVPVLSWTQGAVVTTMRREARVPYPNAYASAEQAKENKVAYKFNCAQRSHHNLLENMPQTMLYILFSGLEYPKAAAGVGAAWLIFRIIFAWGYITSTKAHGAGRLYGGAFWLMQGGLWGMSIATALKML